MNKTPIPVYFVRYDKGVDRTEIIGGTRYLYDLNGRKYEHPEANNKAPRYAFMKPHQMEVPNN